MSRSKVLFMMSGSIAAFKACQVISRLVQDGFEVQVVGTPSLKNFIGAATLEGLTGRKVLSEIFATGHAMDHIELTRWADVGVICPASANTLARLSLGLADDLVSALVLAWPQGKALQIFPAMNTQMWNAEPTQRHVSALLQRGFFVAPTGNGNLACGETGAGRLLEPEQILERLHAVHRTRGNILITAGATRETIDGVRFLSNVSTGQTGSALAQSLALRGWHITYLHGQGALQPGLAACKVEFSSAADLEDKLREQLSQQKFSAVIHAAAVSDYTPSEIVMNGESQPANEQIKLRSDQEIFLRLRQNKKILPQLKEYSQNRGLKVVGFKLTVNADEHKTLNAAQNILGDQVDAIVANDWSQVRADRTRHPGWLMTKSQPPAAFTNLNELAHQLNQFLSEGATT